MKRLLLISAALAALVTATPALAEIQDRMERNDALSAEICANRQPKTGPGSCTYIEAMYKQQAFIFFEHASDAVQLICVKQLDAMPKNVGFWPWTYFNGCFREYLPVSVLNLR